MHCRFLALWSWSIAFSEVISIVRPRVSLWRIGPGSWACLSLLASWRWCTGIEPRIKKCMLWRRRSLSTRGDNRFGPPWHCLWRNRATMVRHIVLQIAGFRPVRPVIWVRRWKFICIVWTESVFPTPSILRQVWKTKLFIVWAVCPFVPFPHCMQSFVTMVRKIPLGINCLCKEHIPSMFLNLFQFGQFRMVLANLSQSSGDILSLFWALVRALLLRIILAKVDTAQ